MPTVVGLSLAILAYLLLRNQGAGRAALGLGGLGLAAGGALVAKALGVIQPAIPWIVGALAVVVVFGLARHILMMAWQSLRRGILNQHVLLEFGAFAGLVGGVIGLALRPAGYPTAPSSPSPS